MEGPRNEYDAHDKLFHSDEDAKQARAVQRDTAGADDRRNYTISENVISDRSISKPERPQYINHDGTVEVKADELKGFKDRLPDYPECTKPLKEVMANDPQGEKVTIQAVGDVPQWSGEPTLLTQSEKAVLHEQWAAPEVTTSVWGSLRQKVGGWFRKLGFGRSADVATESTLGQAASTAPVATPEEMGSVAAAEVLHTQADNYGVAVEFELTPEENERQIDKFVASLTPEQIEEKTDTILNKIKNFPDVAITWEEDKILKRAAKSRLDMFAQRRKAEVTEHDLRILNYVLGMTKQDQVPDPATEDSETIFQRLAQKARDAQPRAQSESEEKNQTA